MRDIDDWVFQFERIAATRLKEIFKKTWPGPPRKLLNNWSAYVAPKSNV